MTLPSYADREARAGGRWSTPGLILDLLRLASLERAVAHVIAAWVPKIPDLDDKLAVASGFEDAMVRASALRQHALTLLERDERGLTIDRDWVAPLRELDRRAKLADVVEGLLVDVPAFLLSRYRALAAQLDLLLDARLIATVHTAIDRLGTDASSIRVATSPGPGGMQFRRLVLGKKFLAFAHAPFSSGSPAGPR